MDILEQLYSTDVWQEYLQYKREKHHISKSEEKALVSYIEEARYLTQLDIICHGKDGANRYPDSANALPLPVKKEINKDGTTKKRVVYLFPADFNQLLKGITYLLYKYDDIFADNCYAFRRGIGVNDAVRRICRMENIESKYCLKVDIRNYFNSIYVPMLLEKLDFLKEQDDRLFVFFQELLMADAVLLEKNSTTKDSTKDGSEAERIVVSEQRGAMAGTPIAPFFANVYLRDVDYYFSDAGIPYFRYSDDILLFAESEEELTMLQTELYKLLEEHHLHINPEKEHVSKPGEMFEFLGLCFSERKVDLSEHTKSKIKAKIRRKAKALRRWALKKNLSTEKAAKGFIHAMNRKFYANEEDNVFSWSRWFFPNLTTAEGLKEIDTYMQEYIRYCVTGRHYKGNYRIHYELMKEWGYRNLVHEYYAGKMEDV